MSKGERRRRKRHNSNLVRNVILEFINVHDIIGLRAGIITLAKHKDASCSGAFSGAGIDDG